MMDDNYFLSNSRFSSLGRIRSLGLVDYLEIYEEGTRWVLTVIEVSLDGSIKHLFLPLTADTASQGNRLSGTKFGGPAFGFQTNSLRYGERHWQVFDAFADVQFYFKLSNLFLQWTGIPQNHVNAYINIKESGIGRFIFHTKHEVLKPLWLNKKMAYQFTEPNLLIKYGDSLKLEIYQSLP